MFYQEGSSLDLDLIIQNYEADREQYWSDDEKGGKYIELVDGLANVLLRGARELVQPIPDATGPGVFDWDQIQYLITLDGVSERVLERLEIDAAWEYSTGTRVMAYRCLELARLVIEAKPNISVMRFLGRLSRCYIAGFLPECVMLCRGVLENAVVETFEAKGIPLPATPEGHSSMRGRLNAATKLGFLTRGAADDAMIVWKRGSKAAHEDPEATKEVLEEFSLDYTRSERASAHGWRPVL